MEGAPWICPRCGTPTNADVCPRCFRERPFDSGATNAPGSHLRIVQGPRGLTSLPPAAGYVCLLIGCALVEAILSTLRLR